MSYKMLFVLNAVIVVVFGLLLFVAPEIGLAQFKMDKVVQEIFMARAIGAALVSLGILLWFAKDVEGAAQKNLSMAALAGSVLGVIVTVIGITKVVKGFGWLALVVEILFALGYAFILFLQPKMK